MEGGKINLGVDCISYPRIRSHTAPINADAPIFIPMQPAKSAKQFKSLLLNAYYCNVCSLRSKLVDLHSLLNCTKSSVLLFTETWCNDNITDGLLDPGGQCNVYRRDRPSVHCTVYTLLVVYATMHYG